MGFRDYLRNLSDKKSGQFVILPGGKRERIPDDWFKVSVRGSSLTCWNIVEDDDVIAEPYKCEIEGNPIIVVDSEYVDAPCSVLKFVVWFDIGYNKLDSMFRDFVKNSRKDDRFVREINYDCDIVGWKKFFIENERNMPGMDPVYWHKLCRNYMSLLTKDNRYKETDSTHIAIVCSRYSYRYQYFMVPCEKIRGIVRYVVDNSGNANVKR